MPQEVFQKTTLKSEGEMLCIFTTKFFIKELEDQRKKKKCEGSVFAFNYKLYKKYLFSKKVLTNSEIYVKILLPLSEGFFCALYSGTSPHSDIEGGI